MKRIAGMLIVGVCAAVAMAAGDADEKTKSARPSIEYMKHLAGTWVELDDYGKPTDTVALTYRVTAGGSAVLETIFPGTEKEMVTLYHQDGEDLVLTHYCMLGNQPKMKAVAGTDTKALKFTCMGGTNMKSENDKHMHQATFTMTEDKRLKSEWLLFENGEEVYVASFTVARKVD